MCAVVVLLGAGCGTTDPADRPAASDPDRAVDPSTPTPARAAGGPSAPAQMICTEDIQGEIVEGLGVQHEPLDPTWDAGVYACDYAYPDGEIAVSVKDLASTPEAVSYFESLLAGASSTRAVQGLGQGAFVVPDGSITLVKDFNVLQVDVTGIPERFGSPARPRADVARTVADLIMACWVAHH